MTLATPSNDSQEDRRVTISIMNVLTLKIKQKIAYNADQGDISIQIDIRNSNSSIFSLLRFNETDSVELMLKLLTPDLGIRD